MAAYFDQHWPLSWHQNHNLCTTQLHYLVLIAEFQVCILTVKFIVLFWWPEMTNVCGKNVTLRKLKKTNNNIIIIKFIYVCI